MAATVLMCPTTVATDELPLSGSLVDFFEMLSELPEGAEIPLHGWLGADEES
jgi:hypothetical protein